MSRQGMREVFFVCSSVTDAGNLISKVISANSANEAISIFKEIHKIDVGEVLGPFHKKRIRVSETNRLLKFSNQTKKAIYNNWIVNAFLLKEPADQAYLVFIKRVDDKKVTTPKGIITVPISDLRYI